MNRMDDENSESVHRRFVMFSKDKGINFGMLVLG